MGWGGGDGNISHKGEAFYFKVTKFYDITNKIIPFFSLNRIHGIKFFDYLYWCQVANIMK